MTTTETQQLTIARAIAYVIERHTGEPGWATESMTAVRLEHESAFGVRMLHAKARLLTTLADARAQWVASGGDPDRGPCLSHDGYDRTWQVLDDRVDVFIASLRWQSHTRAVVHMNVQGAVEPADLRLLADIIDAVEEVTRG